MRPQATGIRKTGTFTGQHIEMSIDTNAMAHIMSVLTNLYSDPEMAVLREYSCNARDSHLAIGSTRPIEVTLPSPIEQYLVIEDFGLGLSLDDITAIYSRYGASTKRDTDEQTGMLGLGSKSALTYATQFTMTSVKNGVKVEVLISVKTNGAGVMEVMDTVATDQANGVRITIPTRPNNSFASKAEELFSLWPAGSVLVNGQAPKVPSGRFLSDARTTFLDDEDSSGARESVVVMGGVPYPLPYEYTRKISNTLNNRVVIYAPMGAVDFVPSREAMNMTPRTEKALEGFIADFEAQYLALVQAEFAACGTKAEAFAVATRVRGSSGIERKMGSFTYKGQDIPSRFGSDKNFWVHNKGTWSSRKNQRTSGFYARDLGKTPLMVTGYSGEGGPSAVMRAKVDKYCDDNGLSHSSYMIFITESILDGWVDIPTVDYATIKAIKVPRAAVASRAGTVVRQEDWDTIDANGRIEEQDGAKITKPVIYYSPVDIDDSRWNSVDRESVRKRMVNDFPTYTIIEAGKGRHARLLREFPTAKTYDVAIKELLDAQRANISDRTVALGTWNQRNSHPSHAWDKIAKGGTINDADLLAEVSDIATAEKTVADYVNACAVWRKCWKVGMNRNLDLTAPTTTLALNNYPLLWVHGIDRHPESVVQYINAAFAAANTKGTPA